MVIQREKSREHFENLLHSFHLNIQKKEVEIFAGKIEKSIWDWSVEYGEKNKISCTVENELFSSIYRDKAVSIYTNLKPETYVQNNSLISKLIQNEIVLEKIAFMSPQELYPENWKVLLDRKFKIDKNLYETRTELATDLYKCGKCKHRLCTYFQLRTRSADEPMTTFVTCLKCGNRWKH